MTEKDFDFVVKNALSSDDVPPGLNLALSNKLKQKRRSAKIYKFTAFAGAIAAMFICATVLLNVYNSGSGNRFNSGSSALPDSSAEDTASTDSHTTKTANADVPPGNVGRAFTPPENSNSGTNMESSDSKSALSFNTAYRIFSKAFDDEFDFVSAFNKEIEKQIAKRPNSSEYTFSGVSENAKFTIDDENKVTIVFPEGEIIGEEHGEQYFTVGKISNGKLKKIISG